MYVTLGDKRDFNGDELVQKSANQETHEGQLFCRS